MSEAGLAGFNTGIWMGLLAPAGTPREVIDKLAHALNGALKSQDVVTGLNRLGMDALGGTPGDFADFIASEIERKTTIVAGSGRI